MFISISKPWHSWTLINKLVDLYLLSPERIQQVLFWKCSAYFFILRPKQLENLANVFKKSSALCWSLVYPSCQMFLFVCFLNTKSLLKLSLCLFGSFQPSSLLCMWLRTQQTSRGESWLCVLDPSGFQFVISALNNQKKFCWLFLFPEDIFCLDQVQSSDHTLNQ